MSDEAVKADAATEDKQAEKPAEAKVKKETKAKKVVKAEKAVKTEKEVKTENETVESADKAEEPVEQTSRSEAAAIMNMGNEEADKAAETAKKKGKGKVIPAGIAFVRSTFNNTIVSIADARGGVISWSSAGKAGFKGSRKSTAFAATMVAQDAARQAMAKGMHEVEVRIQGAGAGRESAVRAIQQAGINVTMIRDCTPIPHNGCRPRKRRRV
jgi:small subunit ribosomal protein S11